MQFRSGLYYRVNVFAVLVPHLRERPEDIPLLVKHFVQEATRQMHKTIDIPSETVEALIRYRRPGNMRQLENEIERAVILSTGPVLRLSHRDLKSRTQPWISSPRQECEKCKPSSGGSR